jgi:two-component system, cell cycle response regulator
MDKQTILVVDDSSTIRKILERELTDAGYEVITAVNGMEAISMLVWMEKNPDLITLDIDMPRMDGFEACAKIREEYQKQHHIDESYEQIPVIFVSANDSLEYRRAGFQLEVLDFITKPFSPGDVAKVVGNILHPTEQFSGQQVLVVDDSAMTRRMINKLLQRLGVEVIEAENGVEALTIVEQSSYDFDLIITDYMMPEMRGDEFCRLVRQQRRLSQVPVLIVSGFDNQDLILAFFKAGATDYLTKPFIEEELLARCQIHLQARLYSRQLEKLNLQLGYLADRDGLTDVYNRRFFQEALQKQFHDAKRAKLELSCILLDLDFFKKVNDECGHGFGDLVLVEFAKILQKTTRQKDIVARYGGEEFILLLPGKSIQQASEVAETIRSLAATNIYSDGNQERQVTVSVGVSSLTTDTPEQPDRFVGMADEAMYLAKENGRNKVCVFSETIS